jgi:hypothetical protein
MLSFVDPLPLPSAYIGRLYLLHKTTKREIRKVPLEWWVGARSDDRK